MDFTKRELALLIACVDSQIANAQRTGVTVTDDLRKLLKRLEKEQVK